MPTIANRLDVARNDLLDLGLRNTLLNHRTLKARGLDVVGETSVDAFQLLVRDNKTLSFSALDLTPPSSVQYFQTNLQEKSLQSRLLATHLAAKTHIEERGVNVLFLALGMLHWFEDDNSSKELRAPLILVPVELQRATARDRFQIRFNEEDVEANISLATRLANDFAIQLPLLPAIEDLDVDAYLSSCSQATESEGRWSVNENEIVLGFFSFGKFLMYRDTDPAKWKTESGEIEHQILTSLLGEGFRESSPTYPDDTFLDDIIAPTDVRHVVDADSSQLLALVDVQRERNLVIQGPPGTGKSQTITNTIADALGRGKKVLFVAEKMAALEVVKRRLDKQGLGDACLELHSHNAHKKAVLAEMKRTLDLGRPKLDDLTAEIERLTEIRTTLNTYCHDLNSPYGSGGYAPQVILGELDRLRKRLEGVRLLSIMVDASSEDSPISKDLEKWGREVFQKKQFLVASLETHLGVTGVPRAHPFRGCCLKIALQSDKQAIEGNLAEALGGVSEAKSSSSELATHMGMPAPTNRKSAALLVLAATRALTAPHIEGVNLRTADWQSRRDDIDLLLKAGVRLSKLHQEYDLVLIPDSWNQNVLETRGVLKSLGNKWWRFVSSDYRQAKRRVAGLCNGAPPKDYQDILFLVDAILDAKRQATTVKEYSALATSLFGIQWQGERSQWEVLRGIYEWVVAIYRDTGNGQLPPGLIDFLAGNPRVDSLKPLIEQTEKALARNHDRLTKVMVSLNYEAPSGELELQELSFTEQIAKLDRMYSSIDQLSDQIRLNLLEQECHLEGIAWVVEIGTSWPEAATHLVHGFRHIYFESILRRILAARASLRTFDGKAHERVIELFRELDRLLLKHNRLWLAEVHWRNLPAREGAGQLGVLLREFEKRSRHLPIRQLVEKAGNAIQAIKPVLMMSPMSVAAFLPPNRIKFDLVIFDEASQVKPVDGFGSILRGSQLVVVGDDRQLPPTSFFDALMEDADNTEDDEESLTSDIESILGLMASKGAPQRMLRWHYRSQHESLIAVSNREFYDDRLVVFPSPLERHRGLGLEYHHLPNTAYDRGGSRTNQKEAEIVARAVMEHARNRPELTLGVAAFSLAQADAITDHLENFRRRDPTVETFFGAHPHEPFFVKNLESVQGDERDVIFISVGYGKTAEGYVSMGFGALNSSGGERRLNVLITRARVCCEVFTNLTHGDIDLERTKARGVMALKSFLKYAQTGILDVPSTEGGEAESPFEESVAEALRKQGLEVVLQVGTVGFFVDIAIKDPAKPGSYILGIECDGATYHRSRSARDRDRLREQVLRSRGWNLVRIWSTDWFHNPDRELRRVLEAFERARLNPAAPHVPVVPKKEDSSIPTEIVRSTEEIARGTTSERAIIYVMAELQIQLGEFELHQMPRERIATWVSQIVNVESPVHFAEVARRITTGVGIQRVGTRIEAAIKDGVVKASAQGSIIARGEFLWHRNMAAPPVRNRNGLEAASRKIELISPEEIAEAIKMAVEDAYGILQEDVAGVVCRLFGFQRTTEDMCVVVNRVLAKLIKSGHLVSSEGHIQTPN